MDIPVLISFSLYMAAMIAIGIYFYFKTDDLRIPVKSAPDSSRTRHPIPVKSTPPLGACC
ncbi:MAG: hypothetical protein CO188_11925 [Zetaproteobacteria bacterium CG_4_9_14_3_um_filter_54_145]|nr:MAG: hypothetical protein CO188_11925 [Zetaproteobacteria bacterium CG_4_9_14_3_um_filter_54_145]